MKRDNFIDFIRGLAAIWIILIHTCFWSGELYTPLWLRSLVLIIDVPLFVFISGMSFNFSNSFIKGLKNIYNIWIKNIYFLVIYFVIIFIYENETFSLNNIIQALFFKYQTNGLLRAVNGSMWFIYMFFIVTILANGIIWLYKKYNDNLKNFKYILVISFLFYGMSLYNGNFIFLDSKILMYNFIYLLGYYLYNYKFENMKKFLFILITNIIILLLLLNFGEYGFLEMQTAKGLAYLSYLSYSLIGIIVVTYLKDHIKIKNNIFGMVGKNALLFYFCQGISASIIYYLYKYIIDFNGILKLVIMFGLNLAMTILLVMIIKLLMFLTDKIKINFKVFIEKT